MVFFWSAECAVEDLGSQLNRHHVRFGAVSLRSLETAETIADCCIFEPAKTLVGTELVYWPVACRSSMLQ